MFLGNYIYYCNEIKKGKIMISNDSKQIAVFLLQTRIDHLNERKRKVDDHLKTLLQKDIDATQKAKDEIINA